jgi:hypothetical protein
VTADDYRRILVPKAEARLKRHGRIRVLYVIGEGFEGFSPGAMMADAEFGFGHLRELGRTALVTNVTWIKNAARLFAPFFRVPLRVFSSAEFDAARDWLLTGAGGDASEPTRPE